MRFKVEEIQYELNGLKSTPSYIIKSHIMENLLKGDYSDVIARLYFVKNIQEDKNIPLKLQCILENNHGVFQEIHKIIPPSRDHGYQIELITISKPLNKILIDTHINKREILTK